MWQHSFLTLRLTLSILLAFHHHQFNFWWEKILTITDYLSNAHLEKLTSLSKDHTCTITFHLDNLYWISHRRILSSFISWYKLLFSICQSKFLHSELKQSCLNHLIACWTLMTVFKIKFILKSSKGQFIFCCFLKTMITYNSQLRWPSWLFLCARYFWIFLKIAMAIRDLSFLCNTVTVSL